MLTRFRALASARAGLTDLRAGSAATLVDLDDDRLFAYLRGRVLCVVEMSGVGRTVQLDDVRRLVHGSPGVTLDGGVLTLPPYGYAWTS